MDAILERSRVLKQALVQFVLEAEGDLAEALETYIAAESGSKKNRYDASYERTLLIDSFLTEGKIGEKTPLDLFIENQSNLDQTDRNLVSRWQDSFIGLFAVTEILPDGFELMNWLSARRYTVKPNDPITLEEMARFKIGEILLARIAPITDTYSMFSGPCIPMGRLGKPKLAVAIGNFKEDHRKSLYSDAPELLEEAWESVALYHQEFVEFFGSNEVTLPGRELNEKIQELQDIMTKRRFAAAGVDESKSLGELLEESGATEEDIQAVAEEAGADSKVLSQMFDRNGKAKMVMPKAELPEDLKRAEQVTVMTHPRWGQIFLPTYTQFGQILASEDWANNPDTDKLVRKYLEDPTIHFYIWQRLAQQYPMQLEKVLQSFLNRPEFKLDRDLENLLQEYGKPLEPDLPDIASVPIHLHNLFQEALAEVQKKSKPKAKKKATKGFR